MNKNFKWYLIIFISVILFGYFVMGMVRNSEDSNITNGSFPENPLVNDKGKDNGNDKDKDENNYTDEDEDINLNSLPIPKILENKSSEKGKAEFDLKVNYGKKEFIDGYKADTLGYNGDYLGPVIKVNKGDEVKINVENTLNEKTTVHWHGLEVPAEMDGGPHQIIEAGDIWKPYFTINQNASTLWYHPHIMGTTGEQVYKGLSGLFYIEDEISRNLDIPKEYGVNDIPLIVQDKRFTGDGNISYNLNMRDLMDGFLGDTVLINGAIEPRLDVKNEMIRLRLLNGSNARNYLFNFTNKEEFYQIASDGGFLEKPIELRELFLAPGERAEILIDLSSYKVGEKIYLKDSDYNILDINISKEGDKNYKIPSKLTEIDKYKIEDIKSTRLFEMGGMGRDVNINGKQMDMNRIDENVKLGELEEWIITNKSMGMMNSVGHPFHIHSTQFQVLERNGKKPALNERGWKDTVMVGAGEEVRVLVRFKEKGLFMYHCHILEHEDLGMMGQFLVEE